jgi:hypothetical protein
MYSAYDLRSILILIFLISNKTTINHFLSLLFRFASLSVLHIYLEHVYHLSPSLIFYGDQKGIQSLDLTDKLSGIDIYDSQ